MEKLESFFQDRGAPVFHETSPIAGKSLLPMLNQRGYCPVELSNVLFMELDSRLSANAPGNNPLRVRVVEEQEQDLWARTAAEGWREFTEIADLMQDLMRVTAARKDGVSFLVELDGQPVAAGGLAVHEGVALLAGASTIPQFRRRGAQRLLLETRLQYAAQAGCDLAMFCAEPGGGSQRNAERQGFRIAYTRTKFGLITA
jgi:GNAT superfamily N-acetyltransferase